MGNTNSSPRYRSRSPDPSSLDQTWNNSYPKVERERSNRSQWQQQQQTHGHQQQQQANQPKQKHSAGGYPAALSTSGSGVMVNGHLNSVHYDQFEQECIQHQQQQQQSKLSDQQPLRFARYGSGVAEAPVQQAKKIRVLPMAANGATGTPGVGAVKLRATDNGLALQKVGTLHIANRKLTELNHNLIVADSDSPIIPNILPNGVDEMRSPTPDYDANNKQRSSSGSRKPSKNKKNSKAKASNTAPSTPAASAKSGSSSRMDHDAQQPTSGGKSSGRGKLRLFKTKSTDGKSADSENGRIRARSMEYLRADLADETQEVRRRHNNSREDLSGDESLLAFIKNGPVTVFSSQKKLNGTMTDDDDWEEMHPSTSFPKVPPAEQQQANTSINSNNNNKPQQFYFGMAPGDVAAATNTAQSLDLDEESRRVMEEFDAVLADSKSGIDRKSEQDEKEVVRLRQSTRRASKSTSSSSSSNQPRRHSSTPPPVIRHSSSSRRTTVHEDQLDHDDEYDQDIALSLRPTLPKKPQQLPRFSPSAAWRALGQSSSSDNFHQRSSSISSNNKLNASSSKASDMSAMDLSDEEDEDEDVMEERIAKNALRPVAPHPPRISNEKSADSGISGDAGSPDAAMVASGGASGRDKPLAMSSPVPPQQHQRNQLQNNWTPQQDLLDDDISNSSSDDETGNNMKHGARNGSCFPASKQRNSLDPTPPKIIPKSQMFSDSSMTDQTGGSRSSSMSKGGRKYRKRNETGGSSRTGDEGTGGSGAGGGAHCIPQKYNSLRKLKRSVSGAFATAFRRGKCSPSDDDDEEESRGAHHSNGNNCDDGNWMLSRSAPNSVLNGSVGGDDGSFPSIRKLQSRSEADLLAQQSHGFVHVGQQYPAYSQPSVLSTQRIVYLPQYDSRIVTAHPHQRHPRLGRPVSMDQSDMMRRSRSADAVFLEAKKQSVGQRLFGSGQSPGSKKFTFQSTVRVHEKRLLEEKLSREAEQKERKRLQETQAMQRVEEEFQKKRAREKANIRQQLRVLQLDHYKHQEQLMILREQQHHQQQRIARLDPEGAPSSISHHRTSSDELPIQQSPGRKSANVRSGVAVESRDKRKETTPLTSTPVSALQQLRDNRGRSNNIRSEDVVDSAKKKTTQPQMDYRREVINSSRSRSAAITSNQSGNPAGSSNGVTQFADHQTKPNNNPERNNNNNNNNVAAAAQQKKKSSSNIYRRLAEITSEEESISSPPPVPTILARSSNPSGMNVKQQQAAPPHSRLSATPVQHVVSSTNGNPANNSKVMTQELSEYRQERREYHDFRSPRLHQQQLITSPSRYYGAGQPSSGHRVLPSSAGSSSTSSAISNKMQSDNYRWDFAHGGRGGHHMAAHPTVMKSTPTPQSVATWQHHHHQAQLLQQQQQQQQPPVFSSRQQQQHDYHHHHHFYKMASPPTDVVMMHRTPQQRHH